MRTFKTGATRDASDNKIDLAWAGGFYDGEGSCCCTYNNGKPFSCIRISLAQNDDENGDTAETLQRFQRIMNCGYIYRKTDTSKQFYASSKRDVLQCIDRLWDHICERKREQITECMIKYQMTMEKPFENL